jgi:UDP-N-acetyl-2-amino-2-deoxyglucuronate dehydrogenase
MSLGNNAKFAVIGKGFIFEKHSQAIKEIGGEIVDTAEKSADPYGWKKTIEGTLAENVVILAPNSLHFGMAKFSAEKGKKVLCEKPLALKSADTKILAGFPNIFTVFQLRHHSLVKKLKEEIKEGGKYEIGMDIAVHRDQDYWESWKGREEESGGFLFNFGIHYFDLLIHIFGIPSSVSTDFIDKKEGKGTIEGDNYICNWKISVKAEKNSQKREFKINGIPYDFSQNENLYLPVYKDFLQKKGIAPKDALHSIELVEKISKRTQQIQ